MREEFDSLGKVMVATDKLWGAQTQRSIENFKIGLPGRTSNKSIGRTTFWGVRLSSLWKEPHFPIR